MILKINLLPAVASLLLFSVLPGMAEISVPGLVVDHVWLSDSLKGDILAEELRCHACHAGGESDGFRPAPAPVLTNVGSRVSPRFLQNFILNPSGMDTTTAMPGMLRNLPENERTEAAEAITHYLVSLSSSEYMPQTPAEYEADLLVKEGDRIYHSIGCIACHQTLDDGKPRPGMISLNHIPDKYSFGSLSEFLFNPFESHPSGRMPDMNLTRDESEQLAAYLLGDAPNTDAALQVIPQLAETGKAFFSSLNCIHCHSDGQTIKPSVTFTSWRHLNPTGGCLSDNAEATVVYALSEDQKNALVTSIQSATRVTTFEDRIRKTMVRFNCLACHERDGEGGVSAEIESYFTTTEPNLGDAARIPPALTGVGAKLKLEWMQKVLFDRVSIRPYMNTRMPQFGEPNLRDLPHWLHENDTSDATLESAQFIEPEGEDRRTFRDAGRDLVGDKGLNCILCHNFNSKPSPQFAGIDLITAPERLNPDWFKAFLIQPGQFRENLIMPEYWPGGKAANPTILEGDTGKQINAIWYYLTLGRSAPDPSGIRGTSTRLTVGDSPVTYRGRSSVAGYRGIAVGFPSGTHFAFDARNGSLSAIWTGDFINVGWSGQGSGNFSPASRHIALPRDVSILSPLSDDQSWPLQPVTNKDQPVDPDPLYPKNHGYQFKGYYFDNEQIPVLMYQSDNVNIEDKTSAGDSSTLTRTISFHSPTDQLRWFRILTGTITEGDDSTFTTPGLAVRILTDDVSWSLDSSHDNPETKELILHLNLPAGRSRLTFEYEILK